MKLEKPEDFFMIGLMLLLSGNWMIPFFIKQQPTILTAFGKNEN